MDRTAIEELFTFTDHGWNVYESVIRPLGDEMLTKPAPGSGWPALSDALAHTVWAYVRWLANPAATSDEPAERVTSWDELEAYRRRVRGRLTDREAEILGLIAEGRSNAGVAKALTISERTVEAACAQLFRKLDLEPSPEENRRVLAVLAFLRG